MTASPGNAVLRRADWRFLVGVPEPESAYCPAGGRVRDAVAAVATRVIESPTEEQCDLAVLRNPTRRALRKACAALEPGGGLYAEWWRPVPGGLGALHRKLRAAGFEDVSCYWPWPPPGRATPIFWLPVDRPEVVRWFLGARSSSRRRPARALWRLLWRGGLLAPVCVTARKPPVAAGGLAGSVLLTGGRSAENKLVALTFEPGGEEPGRAVKVGRVDAAHSALAREGAALRAVHAGAPRAGIPRLLAQVDVAGRLGLAESVISGRPIYEVLRPDTHRLFSLKVTEFLGDLALRPQPRWSEDWQTRVARPALEVLSDFDRVRARRILARVGALPEVCEQRDCSPWNVLLADDGEIALLDWESAEERGVPGLDLIYFLAYAGFFVDGAMQSGQEFSSYRRQLECTTTAGLVAEECAARYAWRVGLHPALMEPLRLLCWLVHARTAVDRGADPSLFLALASHELERQASSR